MRFYRLLLRAFPAAFRSRFGEDMTELFADRLGAARKSGATMVIRLWIRTVADLVTQGVAERRVIRALPPEPGRRPHMLAALKQDTRYALKSLRKQPAFTAAAVATLAVGIGTTAAVFGLADALILRSLPYPAPDQLVVVEETNRRLGFNGNNAAPNFDDWSGRVASFEAAAIWSTADVNLAGPHDLERVSGVLATPHLFELIGARAIAGRTFHDHEREPGRDAVAVLSERAWRRFFAGDPAALGRPVILDGIPHVVIGIAAAPGAFSTVDVWRPLARVGPVTVRRNHA